MAEQATSTDRIATTPEQNLLEQAKWASEAFAAYSGEEVWRIVEAVGAAAAEKARHYADWAVRETGYGVVDDKEYKNLGCSSGLVEYYRGRNLNGYEIDHENKVVKIARPAGVVLALVPSTNPIATTYFKVLICLMTRNSVIICPHPAAKECCSDLGDGLAEVAERAGAPRGAIQVLRQPSISVVGSLMQSDMVGVILATGGPAMVRAAYSSGNPAIGVGPGNVAHYVDTTADIEVAAERIISGAAFDNNLACTCESVVLADREIGDELTEAMIQCGAHAVFDPTERKKLGDFLFPEGNFNPKAIGKSAEWIAGEVGIQVNQGTRVLGTEISEIRYEEVFAREKMFPVVGFMKVDGLDGALKAAKAMILMGGPGHSAAIHSNDPDAVAAFGTQLPVYRIAVNGSAPFVSSGYDSGLPPSVTIGTGYFGRSSVGENVGPDHLIHWTRIAYNEDPAEVMGDIDGAMARWDAERGRKPEPSIRLILSESVGADQVVSISNDEVSSMIRSEIKDMIREIVLEELRDALKCTE
jgi:acyl-CoA reductase-like NAD-dependent aldehyde dehydrogenase